MNRSIAERHIAAAGVLRAHGPDPLVAEVVVGAAGVVDGHRTAKLVILHEEVAPRPTAHTLNLGLGSSVIRGTRVRAAVAPLGEEDGIAQPIRDARHGGRAVDVENPD